MQVESTTKIMPTTQKPAGPLICPRCRCEVPAGSRFCNMCGVALRAKAARFPSNGMPEREAPVKTIRGSPPGTVQAPARTVQAPAKTEQAPAPKPATESQAAESPPKSESISLYDAQLKKSLEFIQRQQGVPAFSHQIQEVMGLMGNDEASFRHLTNTILHDYSLTLAVLRLANSAYYNRSGQPIASVARGVTMIGIDAIKRLAAGLMLLENYEKRDSGIKELLLLAMLTASHTRQSAMRLHMPDVEKAYLCGMFRNMGEILVALHFTEAYERILREINEHKLSEREACMKVLEFNYEDLGRAVGGSWNLPGSVLQAMDPSDPLGYSNGTEDEKLRTLAAFSHELTLCVYRHPPGEKSKALDNLIEKYNSIPDLDRKVVRVLLDEAVTETKDTFSTVGIPLNDLHLRRQHSVALTGEQVPKDSESATLATVTESAEPAAAPAPSGEPGGNGDLLSQLVAEVKSAMEPGHELKLNEILMMAMEACHRGARFDRVVFCLATPDRSMVRGRLGLGLSIDDVIEQIQIPLSGQQEALTLALLTKRDLFIDAEHDDRYKDSNLIRNLHATCFGLYPVIVDNVVVGCLYCDRLTPNSFPPQAIFDTIGQLRDLLAELIRRTRQRT